MEEKMLKLKAFIFLAILGMAVNAAAFMPFEGSSDQAVSIAYYDQDPTYLANLRPITINDQSWFDFINKHGQWTGQINTLTGMIHRAYGSAIYVGIPKSEESARDLALSFLESNFDLLKIPISDLVNINSRHRGHHWFVDFKQQYRGVDVFGSRISVRISDQGNVVLFQGDYFPGINISSAPGISTEAARNAMTLGLVSSVQETSEPSLLVFPIPMDNGFSYRLGYQGEVATGQPARWMTIIDATTGEIFYRKNLIDYFTVDGYINGQIFPTTPFDTLVTRPFEFENVSIVGLTTQHTDANGFFTANVPDSTARRVNLTMVGRYVTVRNAQGTQAAITDTITPGETLFVNWATPRSRNDERTTYYQVNVVHDFIKAIDPDFTDLDNALNANVNLNETCNAYWDGSAVNFFMSGGGCSNTGEIADVIYHEYGHGITDFQYRPSAPSDAQHEGWSDYTAATITNQPLIGRGFYSGNPDQYLRTVDNTNRYPEDWQGESHNDGLIISGALWDLREALSPRTGYCDSLFHFARYGLSSNYDDYLVDVLEYDDNDDTLFNGTPHWTEITTAFNLHGIRVADQLSIFHNPLGDTLDTTHPFNLTATVTTTFTPVNDDSVFINYRLGNSGPFQRTQMIRTGGLNEYAGSIPAQPLGTLVEYYLAATNRLGGSVTAPATAPQPTFFFFVGQLTTLFADSLERTSGWIIGTPDDDATTGIWTRVDPIGTFADSFPNVAYQPEDDHTRNPGIYCYITGQQPSGDPNNGANDVDGGKTSLTTPYYDLSTYTNPVIEYFRWFTTNKNVDDTFEVEITGDSGQTWMPIEIVTSMANSWTKARILVDQVVSQRSRVMLRFSATDRGTGSIVEGGVDDLTIYSFNNVSVDDGQVRDLPTSYTLNANYPNPFNGRTEISYALPRASDVTLSIYDIAGRLVYQTMIPNQNAGLHSLIWDSRQAGIELASGVYLYRLQASDFAASRKMLLLK
jgi:Zn-dependent metalloprotease